MALSLNTVFEVRGASGNDTNGGGFVTGAAGSDYSQQGAKNSGANDKSVTDGVTAGSTTVTSATANFGTTIVGNIIYISGGTGSITGGWYQVTARGSSSSITVDRSTGLTAGTGVTLNIGGALATIQQALTNMTVQGMTTAVKADGTYSISTGLTNGAGGATTRTWIYGYTTARGDGGKVTIQASAAITMLTQSQQGWVWENFIFDGNSATATNGINHSNSNGATALINCVLKNFSGYGWNANTNSSVVFATMDRVEVTGCGGTAGINASTCNLTMSRCYIHGNTVPGVIVASGGPAFNNGVFLSCIFANNSGATSDGLLINNVPNVIRGCVFYNNGRDGLRLAMSGRSQAMGVVDNNIFSTNGAYGFNMSSGGSATIVFDTICNNAYYNNTTNPRNNFVAEAGAVTLTADPFTSAGTDFTLNNTAGGGHACKAAGVPGALPTATGSGYADIGVYRHQDPAGGGSLLVHPGMTGGMHG